MLLPENKQTAAEKKLREIHDCLADLAADATPEELERIRKASANAQMLLDGIPRESLQFDLNLHVCLRDEFGNIKQEDCYHNVICTAGKNKLLAVSSGEQLTAFAYIAIGTGTTAVSSSDTTLQTEVARSTVITPTNPTSSQYQLSYTFGAGVGTGTITESGILDAASSGNLLAHQTFGAYTKGASDTLTMTWQIS